MFLLNLYLKNKKNSLLTKLSKAENLYPMEEIEDLTIKDSTITTTTINTNNKRDKCKPDPTEEVKIKEKVLITHNNKEIPEIIIIKDKEDLEKITEKEDKETSLTTKISENFYENKIKK